MGIGGALAEPRAERAHTLGRRPGWTAWGWAAIALVVGFIAITCWWLARDRGVPVFDSGTHLYTAMYHYDLLRLGEIGRFRTSSDFYPPVTFLVGGLSMLVTGGPSRWVPVVAQNLIYVPLLALGCFGTGRLLAGSRAGCLAVAFALGAPLLIEQFHVFMIDAPVAALVAVSVWLILESQRFQRVGVAAAAGLAVGVGLASKEQFPLFVAGLLVVVLARGGGWRNWRGIAAFAAVAFVVGAPWYLANLSELGTYASAGLAGESLPARGKPPLLSLSNLGWYFWATQNALLFAPLFAFAAIGVVTAAVATVRARRAGSPPPLGGYAPELLAGLSVAWLALSITPHHDMRYTLPLVVYLATLGTAWIVGLAPRPRRIATVALAGAIVATTLGATFGAGREVRIVLPGGPVETSRIWGIPPPSQITLYSPRDYIVSGPRRDSDVRALFEALRGEGVTGVFWENAFLGDPVFDTQGLAVLSHLAGLRIVLTPQWDTANPRHALLVRQPLGHGTPCMDLGDGTAITVLVGDPATGQSRAVCPSL